MYQKIFYLAMDKIQNLIPNTLIGIADKYAKAKEERCRINNNRFRKKAVSVARNFCVDMVMGLAIIILLIAGLLFLRKTENDK